MLKYSFRLPGFQKKVLVVTLDEGGLLPFLGFGASLSSCRYSIATERQRLHGAKSSGNAVGREVQNVVLP